jgi:dipicolinate synthase subunit A
MEDNILLLGGDKRNYILYHLLKNDYKVSLSGFDKFDNDESVKFTEIEKSIEDFNIVIAPIPLLNDKGYLFMPFAEEYVDVDRVINAITYKQCLISGRIPCEIANKLKLRHIGYYDLLEREEIAVLNAIPTAEGAVMIAMQEIPITINSAKVLVLGYGRLGKVLSNILHGMGADLCVCSRRYTDNAYCRANGYKHVYLDNLNNCIGSMDIIVNTIPKRVICQEQLELIKGKELLIVDLASVPGGVDHDSAKRMNIKTIWALSLPGKVAPKTSALYLKEAIINILNEKGGVQNESK